MNKSKFLTTMIGALLLLSTQLFAQGTTKVVRATKLSPALWGQFHKGEIECLQVEFRQGDEIPVQLNAEGDLLETSESNPSYVTVKRGFWVQMKQDDVQISFDGTNYKPFKEAIAGTITAGASSDEQGGIANAINLGFKLLMK